MLFYQQTKNWTDFFSRQIIVIVIRHNQKLNFSFHENIMMLCWKNKQQHKIEMAVNYIAVTLLPRLEMEQFESVSVTLVVQCSSHCLDKYDERFWFDLQEAKRRRKWLVTAKRKCQKDWDAWINTKIQSKGDYWCSTDLMHDTYILIPTRYGKNICNCIWNKNVKLKITKANIQNIFAEI